MNQLRLPLNGEIFKYCRICQHEMELKNGVWKCPEGDYEEDENANWQGGTLDSDNDRA